MSSQPLAAIEREPIPPGTLDMLILKTLVRTGTEQLHGFEIAEAIQQRSRSVLQVEEGSLYPALQRMLVKGWIAGEWGHTPERRRARYYRITPPGKKQLERELESYKRVTAAVALIIQSA
jgi:PadR family transcriptional regulator